MKSSKLEKVKSDTKGMALFSQDDRYRYVLTREWDETKGTAVFIGLNPSTADHKKDDPTIRRCIAFAKAWGMGGLIMLNLFAYRSTDPKELNKTKDPVGPLNDYYLDMYSQSGLVVAAWGTKGNYMGRAEQVIQSLPSVFVLGLTKGGHPKHPLYLKKDLLPMPWVKT